MLFRSDGTQGNKCFGICGVAVGIPSLRYWNSNLRLESRRGTLLGGQFDWGGRLLKSSGGVQRLARPGRKPGERLSLIHIYQSLEIDEDPQVKLIS